MGLISCAKKYPVSTFHPKNPALQDSILVFNQDCELVSQLPTIYSKNKETVFFIQPPFTIHPDSQIPS